MRLTIVGSGGCMPLPRPGCFWAVCSKARQKGIPYARSGPAVYVDDEAVLYAPCDVCGLQLENVAHCQGIDLLLLECWVPITGQRRKGLPSGHAWQSHLSEEEGLALLDYLRPKRTVLTHIDGARHRSPEIDHDILLELVKSYPQRVEIAYDGLRLVV